MDASTLIIVFLLVTLASLASYLLSQWSFIRNGAMSMGWVAISIGTILLLAAAVMVVLTTDLLPVLRIWPNDEPAKQMNVQFGLGIAETAPAPREMPTEVPHATIESAVATDRGASSSATYTTESRSEHRSAVEPASTPGSLQAASSPVPRSFGLVFAEADPWAATKCVVAFNPDPADLTRWTMENDCGAPVAVVFASCSNSSAECDDRQSTSWEYPNTEMIFPDKAQRPVTHAEETRYGRQIRYVACVIGPSPNAARSGDPCLVRVQQWSSAGRNSGKSIDVLLGANTPVKIHPRVTFEP